MDDLTAFNQSLPAPQHMEITEKHIIIHNAPDCDCYKNIVSNFMIKSGYCKSESDIRMLKSGVMLIDRSQVSENECLTPIKSENECMTPIKKVNAAGQPNSCKEWCDHFAIAGSAWCLLSML